jgi:hypothetical protein
METGRTSLAQKILALAVAAAYLGMFAFVIVNVARRASLEMARVRARKPSRPAQLGAQIVRLLPRLRRLR